MMKQEINKAEVKKFNQSGKIFTVLFVTSIMLFAPLVVFWKIYGAVIWAILYLITLGFAFRVEKLKKGNDIHTYKEIVAFSEGKHLDEIQKQREIGKRPYQAVLKVMAGAGIGIIVGVIAVALINS